MIKANLNLRRFNQDLIMMALGANVFVWLTHPEPGLATEIAATALYATIFIEVIVGAIHLAPTLPTGGDE